MGRLFAQLPGAIDGPSGQQRKGLDLLRTNHKILAVGIDAHVAVWSRGNRLVVDFEQAIYSVTGGCLKSDWNISCSLIPKAPKHVVEPRWRLRRRTLVTSPYGEGRLHRLGKSMLSGARPERWR